jgi:hypothetical protein
LAIVGPSLAAALLSVCVQCSQAGYLCRNAVAIAFAVMVACPVDAQVPATHATQQWQSLYAQANEAYRGGDYPRATEFAEEALGLARQIFGDRAPQTLTSINNLASFYATQSRYAKAEPL